MFEQDILLLFAQSWVKSLMWPQTNLRVGEHLLNVVDRATGDTGAFKASQPLSSRLLHEPEDRGLNEGLRRDRREGAGKRGTDTITWAEMQVICGHFLSLSLQDNTTNTLWKISL